MSATNAATASLWGFSCSGSSCSGRTAASSGAHPLPTGTCSDGAFYVTWSLPRIMKELLINHAFDAG
jgi:hypothetical protein